MSTTKIIDLENASLKELSEAVQALRYEILCCAVGDSLQGVSAQNYLFAISHLEMAQGYLNMANLQK